MVVLDESAVHYLSQRSIQDGVCYLYRVVESKEGRQCFHSAVRESGALWSFLVNTYVYIQCHQKHTVCILETLTM